MSDPTCPGIELKDIFSRHCGGCTDIAKAEFVRDVAKKEVARLQRKLDVIDGEVVAYGADGCLTGDCPHERQAECNAALAKSYVDFIEDLRAILDAENLSDEWTARSKEARAALSPSGESGAKA